MKKQLFKSFQEFLQKWDFLVTKEQLEKLCIDYWNNPVKKKKLPKFEDLKYLLIDLNLSYNCVADYFKVTPNTIVSWCKKLNIHKSKQQIYKLTKFLNLRKYGVENPKQLEEIKQKARETCLNKYGYDNPMKNKQIKQKVKETCLERYGVENPMKKQEFKDKLVQTNLERFGVPCSTQNELVKQKMKNSVPKMLEKSKKTCMEKYGVPFSLQDPQIRQKGKETCLKKYNNECYVGSQTYFDNLNTLTENCYKTKKKNNSLNKSLPEDKLFLLLQQKFGQNVKRQYRSQVYPFVCDFYIINLNLYIEYQGYWTHGDEPFDANNKKHRQLVDFWLQKSKENNFKDKNKNLYKCAINTWTIKDPKKRKIAKENNLNWIEFFNMEQFLDWFNQI